MSETRPDFDHDPTKASTVRVVRKSSLPDSQERETDAMEIALTEIMLYAGGAVQRAERHGVGFSVEALKWIEDRANTARLATRPEPTDVREALEASLGARATAYARGEE